MMKKFTSSILVAIAAVVSSFFVDSTSVLAGGIVDPSKPIVGQSIDTSEAFQKGELVLVSKDYTYQFVQPSVGHNGTYVRTGRVDEYGWVHYRSANQFKYESLSGQKLICDKDSDQPLQVQACKNLIWVPSANKIETKTYTYKEVDVRTITNTVTNTVNVPSPYEKQVSVTTTVPQPAGITVNLPAAAVRAKGCVIADANQSAGTRYEWHQSTSLLDWVRAIVPLGASALRRPDSIQIAGASVGNVTAAGGAGGSNTNTNTANGGSGYGYGAAAASSSASSGSTSAVPGAAAGASNGTSGASSAGPDGADRATPQH